MNRKKSKAFVPSTSATSPAPIAVAVIVAEPEALARELGREAAAQVGVLGPVRGEQLLVGQATGALGFLLQKALLLKEAVGLWVQVVALLAAPRRSAAGAASRVASWHLRRRAA